MSEPHKKAAETRKRMQAEAEAVAQSRAEALAREWCGMTHRTWARQAKCQWGLPVSGEGPYATREGDEIHLWATFADAVRETPDPVVVRLRKGVHRKARRKAAQ